MEVGARFGDTDRETEHRTRAFLKEDRGMRPLNNQREVNQ
jgi:hypothetical protein